RLVGGRRRGVGRGFGLPGAGLGRIGPGGVAGLGRAGLGSVRLGGRGGLVGAGLVGSGRLRSGLLPLDRLGGGREEARRVGDVERGRGSGRFGGSGLFFARRFVLRFRLSARLFARFGLARGGVSVGRRRFLRRGGLADGLGGFGA